MFKTKTMLTEAQRTQLQALRQTLLGKTLDELKQLVQDANLQAEIGEGRVEMKPAYVQTLMQAERRKYRALNSES